MLLHIPKHALQQHGFSMYQGELNMSHSNTL
jgi:hypothetical protein